jgi:hypothetical protein
VFFDIAGDLTYSTNSTSKEPLIGQSGQQGYKVSWVYGSITATFRDTSILSTLFFEVLNNVTITCQLANGKTVLGINMFCVDVQTISTPEATFEAKFNGTVVAI